MVAACVLTGIIGHSYVYENNIINDYYQAARAAGYRSASSSSWKYLENNQAPEKQKKSK